MKEMMKRCLSLGASLTVVFLTGRMRSSSGQQLSSPAPNPGPVLEPAPQQALSLPPATLSGTIVRDGGRFALRDFEGALYALDSTGRAWPFEGEEVRVTGYLDGASRMLHVCAIEEIEDLRAEAV